MFEHKPLRVVIFGATGTVGSGALLECLDSPVIGDVLCVVRRPTGRTHAKLTELIHSDFTDFSAVASTLAGFDACFWCVGIPVAGATEERYTEITHDYTVAAARVLREQSPGLRFVFVSGAGADETGQGRTMWARVK
jgi:nucleoside-diphosphate-sugar epimerase